MKSFLDEILKDEHRTISVDIYVTPTEKQSSFFFTYPNMTLVGFDELGVVVEREDIKRFAIPFGAIARIG